MSPSHEASRGAAFSQHGAAGEGEASGLGGGSATRSKADWRGLWVIVPSGRWRQEGEGSLELIGSLGFDAER